MLGRAVCEEFEKTGFDLVTIGRLGSDLFFDISKTNIWYLELDDGDYIINCVGLISHLIDDDSVSDTMSAMSVNALFPHELASYASTVDIKVIQIATDCVFSGESGSYVESSKYDALDVYGVTKSIGEVRSESVMNIRASIIGREQRGFKSLLEWVLKQPLGSEISGYTDRFWNGVTTEAFARVVGGIISEGTFRPGLQHLVPKGVVTKAELVSLIAKSFGREDLHIRKEPSGVKKDLTLASQDPEFNSKLWHGGKYSQIPTIQQMISELPG
jgi:dTDP-4-dehydrorhamnose reductase